MCLDILNEEVRHTEGEGYKVVRRFRHGYQTNLYRVFLKEGEWVSDPNDGMAKGYVAGGSYQTGFHIWDTLDGARDWMAIDQMVVRVAYREVVATGYQGANLKNHYPVTVARKIKVLEEVG